MVRRFLLLAYGLVFIWVSIASAQDEALIVEDVTVAATTDAFGLEVQTASGFLSNNGTTAYNNISLLAEVYNSNDTLIGEGFGFLVNACGEALLPDFTMQPGMTESFALRLDIFEEDAEIDRVEVTTDAVEADTTGTALSSFMPGVTGVTRREVVSVEWLDNSSLRYSTGCWRDLFNERTWYEYNLSSGIQQAVTHPRAEAVTDALRATLDLGESDLFDRSFFTFGPGERRAVYQTELNTLVTVEPDGSFTRVLYDRLYNISLQDIYFPFASGGTFIAYYFGSQSDPVSYITANTNGQQLSQSPKDPGDPVSVDENFTSIILPGVSANGKRVIVAREVDGVTGYYLRATDTDFTQLLFEGEAPGNNWPAPLYHLNPENQREIYIARPVDGQAQLQCYNIEGAQLYDITRLPLELANDARARMWMAPDGLTIALAANGINGGLWLIDLSALPACQ